MPEVAARRLAEAALDPNVDLTALVDKAIEDHARNLAWDSLNLQLYGAADRAVASRSNEARIDAQRDQETIAKTTLADIKRNAEKFNVEDVFDAVAIVNAEADTAALASLKRSLSTLGTIAHLDIFPADDFRGLLRFVDYDAVAVEYADPVAKSTRTLDRTRRLDLDRTLVDIAAVAMTASRCPPPTTTPRSPPANRSSTRSCPLPAPRFDPLGGTTRHRRRRKAVGPSGH